MRRWVKAGSKGIALINKDGIRPRLTYVFDVADTRPVRGARMPYLWELKDEHHAAVLDTLVRRYGETENQDIGQALMEQAKHAVEEVYPELLADLAYDTQGSLLEELDAFAVVQHGVKIFFVFVCQFASPPPQYTPLLGAKQ
ncbi:hypothetical protein D5272_02190 [bacterium D16-76]|nr:hypothetical protein [bacterium D16-76]